MKRSTTLGVGLLTVVLFVGTFSAQTAPTAAPVVLREDHQVIQRDEANKGQFRVAVIDATATDSYRVRISGPKNAKVLDRVVKASPSDSGGQTVDVMDVPVGGPYRVEVSPARGSANAGSTLTFDDVLVGDLWVTGGQSNMFGAAIPEGNLPAIPGINVLDNKLRLLEAHWDAGKPPIHRNQNDKLYGGRYGPAYFFARQLYKETGVPIGLIPAAQGGSLAIWDPANRAKNRYGFMEHHIKSAGGRIRGMIWYQGEQDAIFGDDTRAVVKPVVNPVSTYVDRYEELVKTMRQEFGGPEMPVILAQVNAQYHPPYYSVADYDDKHVDQKKLSTLMPGGVGWEKVREAQRQIAATIPNVRLVSTIDLTLMDGLHLDFESQRTVGERMATLALPFIKKSVAARPGIDFASAQWGKEPNSIVVKFKGVTGRLKSGSRPVGFEVRGLHRKTGEGESWVFRTDFVPGQPDTVILRVNGGVPKDGVLYYASGPAPYANIVDEAGLAVPAFGPVKIEPGPVQPWPRPEAASGKFQ